MGYLCLTNGSEVVLVGGWFELDTSSWLEENFGGFVNGGKWLQFLAFITFFTSIFIVKFLLGF